VPLSSFRLKRGFGFVVHLLMRRVSPTLNTVWNEGFVKQRE
jgi:hypothetical protein